MRIFVLSLIAALAVFGIARVLPGEWERKQAQCAARWAWLEKRIGNHGRCLKWHHEQWLFDLQGESHDKHFDTVVCDEWSAGQ